MRVLVIGASGRTGQLVVNEVLERGHSVRALVRKPESLQARTNLLVVKGTPEAKEDVRKAILSLFNDIPQAVSVTLNAPRETDSPFSKPIVGPRFMADIMTNIKAAMESSNIKRIVLMHSNMAYQFKDHGFVDREVRDSGLDWVLVRPAMLTDRAAQPIKVSGTRFLVDAAVTKEWVHRTPVISNQ
ncbi:NAD(P)-binding protein [Tothia fuscella]|uniref:NAD(P)-binding protein n=1 Tax=Tothia fuscella TaxID=1048955 RepID=A0A9P4NEV8_9PEZI|nr:NAD(P)-binding protein [Tothia fuscella]